MSDNMTSKKRLYRLLRRVDCWLFGHDLYVLQHFGRGSRRICCDHCGGDWGMHDGMRAVIPWSGELAEMYELMGYRIRER